MCYRKHLSIRVLFVSNDSLLFFISNISINKKCNYLSPFAPFIHALIARTNSFLYWNWQSGDYWNNFIMSFITDDRLMALDFFVFISLFIYFSVTHADVLPAVSKVQRKKLRPVRYNVTDLKNPGSSRKQGKMCFIFVVWSAVFWLKQIELRYKLHYTRRINVG